MELSAWVNWRLGLDWQWSYQFAEFFQNHCDIVFSLLPSLNSVELFKLMLAMDLLQAFKYSSRNNWFPQLNVIATS